MLKVRCHKVTEVDEWPGHLTADLDVVEEVPVEEAEVEIKNISNYIKSESTSGIFLPSCTIEKELPVWKWKEQLWIEIGVWEKEFVGG